MDVPKLDCPPDVDMQSTLNVLRKGIFDKKSSIVDLGAINDGDLLEWYPSQVKGPVDDEVQEGKDEKFFCENDIDLAGFCLAFAADLISTIEFNEDGELLAVGDKGGRIVVFQREQQVC